MRFASRRRGARQDGCAVARADRCWSRRSIMSSIPEIANRAADACGLTLESSAAVVSRRSVLTAPAGEGAVEMEVS